MPRFRVVAAGLFVAGLAVLLATTPASAHDELIGSKPSQGESLAAAPEVVTLEFSADMLELGAVISIIDADGTEWIASEATYDGPYVSAVVDEAMPEGGYQMRWRAFSNDGHPISGIVGFAVGNAELLEQTPVASGAEAKSTAPANADSLPSEPGPWRPVLIGAGGAAVAGGLYALFISFRRRRQPPGGTGASEHSSRTNTL